MKIFVKTLKDTHFEIEVQPEDTVADVKKSIETFQGPNKCPAAKQLLVHQGNVLKDDTTLQDNKVAENSFIVIMLTKTKGSPGEGSSIPAAPKTKIPISTPLAAPSPVPAPVSPAAPRAPTPERAPAPTLSSAPGPAATLEDAFPPAPAPAPAPAAAVSPNRSETGARSQGASDLVFVTNFNQTVQKILDMGGGSWDGDTVARALRAAHNNPDRAVEYMYIGIPEQDNVSPSARAPDRGQPANPPSSSGSNANLLHLFPQGGSNTGGAGVLDFLRHSPQFQALRAIVQANPQMLQPMLQELGKQNPQVVRLIQEHQADFRRLINEPIEGGEGNILGELATAVPRAIQVTPAEREAIERLEAMGFDRATVLEVYFACNKNEELAANYLLDHLHEFED